MVYLQLAVFFLSTKENRLKRERCRIMEMRHHGEGVVGNVKLEYVMGKEGENGNRIEVSDVQLTTSHQVWIRTRAGDIVHESCGHQTKC